MEFGVVGWSVVKWSEGLSNRASNIIRRYIDHMKFGAYVAFSSITFFHVLLGPFFIIVYMVVCLVSFCLILWIMHFYCYVYVFLLLCKFCSVYCLNVLFYVLFVCKCVLYYCHRLATHLQLTNISYHIKIKWLLYFVLSIPQGCSAFFFFPSNFTHLNYVCHIGMLIAKLTWCTVT